MRQYLSKFIALFLIAATLFASTGVVIASHYCSSGKKSDVSFFQHKGCCSKNGKNCSSFPSSTSGFKKNCCQLSINFHKLNFNADNKNGSVHSDVVSPAISPSFQKVCLVKKSFSPKPDYKSGGIDFLLTIHLLLI